MSHETPRVHGLRVLDEGVTVVNPATVMDFTGAGVAATNPSAGKATVTIAAGAMSGSQEKSTTTPDGIQTTFTFAHTPTIIFWNGAMQTLTDDYTVSGSTITFTAAAGIPQTGDKITNVYA